MPRTHSPRPGHTRFHRTFSNGGGSESGDAPERKRPRSDRHSSHHRSLPSWLTRSGSSTHHHVSHQGPLTGPLSHGNQSMDLVKQDKDITRSGRHSRVYVGNLPLVLRLPNDAYKELFNAVYVTAFGSLKAGEMSPAQSFWMHTCGRYGFLQMRGPKEAVNVMLFNGLTLHGKKLSLSRPTGYRPDLKDLKAEDYVPDRASRSRIQVLVKSMGGIITEPTERSYLVATQQVLSTTARWSDKKTGCSGGTDKDHTKPVDSIENSFKDRKDDHYSSGARGKVVVLVDILKCFDLDDKVQYEEVILDVRKECSRFGKIENIVIPRTGTWVGSVFVELDNIYDATKTMRGMSNRSFEGKKIEAHVIEGCYTAEEAVKMNRKKHSRFTELMSHTDERHKTVP